MSSIAITLTVAATSITLWPVIGWETPNQHEADVLEFVGEVREFRDEWKCDEYEEELLILLHAQADGDATEETKREIEKLREKIKRLDCQRFEDYG